MQDCLMQIQSSIEPQQWSCGLNFKINKLMLVYCWEKSHRKYGFQYWHQGVLNFCTLSIWLRVLSNNYKLFMCAVWALIQIQIKWTAAACPAMSAPWTATVLFPLPLREASQQTVFVTYRPQTDLWLSTAGMKVLLRKTSATKATLFKAPQPNRLQWRRSLTEKQKAKGQLWGRNVCMFVCNMKMKQLLVIYCSWNLWLSV